MRASWVGRRHYQLYTSIFKGQTGGIGDATPLSKSKIPIDAEALEQAFSLFSQASDQLTGAYHELQQRVEQLTGELAVANGELRRQYLEKEALSQRLALLLAALPAGVAVLDAAGEIQEANPAARSMLDEALVGERWNAVVARRLRPTATPNEWESMGIDPGERPRQMSIVASSLDSAGGRILLLHDTTDAHRMQQELQRRQRLAAMGEMAAGLAHQLRTPLATALLYTANLAKPRLPEGERVRFAEKALARLRHLERLIQDMLSFVKGETEGRERVPVSPLLAEMLQIMEPQMSAQGLRLEALDHSGAAEVLGNRKALAGALLNLLENAMQACDAGATVKIVAEVDADTVMLRVIDTGRGIEETVRERLFEPFFTTRSEGTGLGLAIVRGVMESQGGSVAVHSVAGAGSEFVLRLPRAD